MVPQKLVLLSYKPLEVRTKPLDISTNKPDQKQVTEKKQLAENVSNTTKLPNKIHFSNDIILYGSYFDPWAYVKEHYTKGDPNRTANLRVIQRPYQYVPSQITQVVIDEEYIRKEEQRKIIVAFLNEVHDPLLWVKEQLPLEHPDRKLGWKVGDLRNSEILRKELGTGHDPNAITYCAPGKIYTSRNGIARSLRELGWHNDHTTASLLIWDFEDINDSLINDFANNLLLNESEYEDRYGNPYCYIITDQKVLDSLYKVAQRYNQSKKEKPETALGKDGLATDVKSTAEQNKLAAQVSDVIEQLNAFLAEQNKGTALDYDYMNQLNTLVTEIRLNRAHKELLAAKKEIEAAKKTEEFWNNRVLQLSNQMSSLNTERERLNNESNKDHKDNEPKKQNSCAAP